MQKKITHLVKTIAYKSIKILFIGGLFLAGCSQNGEFTLLSGEKQSLDDYQGRWLVVNFWAEWCAPCLEEVPQLNYINSDQFAQQVDVVGVSFDPLPNAEIEAIVKKWQIGYPVMASDPVPILPFGLPEQLPTNYLINPQGKVVKKLLGKQDFQSIMKAIAELDPKIQYQIPSSE